MVDWALYVERDNSVRVQDHDNFSEGIPLPPPYPRSYDHHHQGFQEDNEKYLAVELPDLSLQVYIG